MEHEEYVKHETGDSGKAIHIKVHGTEFRSFTKASHGLWIQPWEFRHWLERNVFPKGMTISDKFIKYLKEEHYTNLALFVVKSLRIKASSNKQQFVLDTINKSGVKVKSVEEYLESIKDVKIGLFNFPSLLNAIQMADKQPDILEVAYLKCVLPDISLDLLVNVPFLNVPD